jgi:hypothetical protein
MGVVAFVLMRFATEQSDHAQMVSYIFGAYNHWPSWLHPFWPAELLCTIGYVTLLAHVLMRAVSRREGEAPRSTVAGIAHMAAGFFAVGGSIGGIIGTSRAGWYLGIEYFFRGGIFLVTFVAIMSCIMGVLYVICQGFARVSRRFSLARRLSWVTIPFVMFRNYMEARDVVDEARTDVEPKDD